MWDAIEHKLALLELVTTGKLRRRKNQAVVWAWLEELTWTRRTGRRDELTLERVASIDAKQMLDQVWPTWSQTHEKLLAAGLPINEHGWRQFQDIKRSQHAAELPQQLNRRTALAHVSDHSKTTMSQSLRQSLVNTHLTHDGIIRLRPSVGLRLRSKDHEIDARVVANVLGEIVLTERALSEGTVFDGILPRFILTVENLGPYLDVRVPDDCLVAHVPGWDTRMIREIFEQLPRVPIVHFGDLDPNAVRIIHHLRELRPDIHWLVPAFWDEYVTSKGLVTMWPADLELKGTPDLVRSLASAGLWLEQETIVLDTRLADLLGSLSWTQDGWL